MKKVTEFKKEDLEIIESQLSFPEGEKGIEIAVMMNETNIKMTTTSITALQIQDSQVVVELGHGNCKHLDLILNKANNIKFYGLEISETMFNEAIKLNQPFIENNKADFYLYDGEEIPFESNSINKIMTVNTLYFWDKPIVLLNELYRILKPNGKLVITFAKEEFMKNLPFVGQKFRLFTNQKALELISKSKFKVESIINENDIVMSKHGEKVQRLFSVLSLTKN